MKLRLLIEIKINFFQSCKPIIVDWHTKNVTNWKKNIFFNKKDLQREKKSIILEQVWKGESLKEGRKLSSREVCQVKNKENVKKETKKSWQRK